MNVVKLNGVKVYNLTAQRSLPEWASRSEKRRKLSEDASFSRHIELIQELEMPDSTTHLTVTPDQRYLFALGRYKPRIRCYELSNLSLKFDRCIDYLPYRMKCLSEDYSKFVLLEEERWVDVHATGGHYFRFRVPKPTTDLEYCEFNCDLFIVSSKNTIYRMSLKEGRFSTPLSSPHLNSQPSHGFTSCAYNKSHSLLLASSTVGKVDGWDGRTGECVFGMNVALHAPQPEDMNQRKSSQAISHITYMDELNLAVGTDYGMVHIYDIRQNKKPWHSRDTEYRKPIKTIAFHEDKVIAALSNCMKIWSIQDGKIFVGFDTGNYATNWMHHFPNSGLLMLAKEAPRVSTYFIPLLGEAPAWCGRLDRLVLECEPDASVAASMYDGYRFLTRSQLSELGMLDLIGTPYLRAYMHGYFVSIRLYNKIRAKLGLLTENVKVTDSKSGQSKSSNVNKAISRDEAFTQDLTEAALDDRFAKLGHDPKLKFNTNNKDSDLMTIHQSRLDKKRRRKDSKKERAVRADALVKDE